MIRTRFTPERGQTYRNAAGGKYRCVAILPSGGALMQSTSSGWGFVAHGCHVYEDGSIDWDYSTDGHFEEVS